MILYRRLDNEELLLLEKEFVSFLVVNGIQPEDWVKMKEKNIDKVDKILDEFSNVIMEGVLRKTKFLDFISPKSIKSFQCLDDKIILVGIDVEDRVDFDFTKINDFKDISKEIIPSLSVYTQEKKYKINRNKELFEMIEKGAIPSNGDYFKNISLLLVN